MIRFIKKLIGFFTRDSKTAKNEAVSDAHANPTPAKESPSDPKQGFLEELRSAAAPDTELEKHRQDLINELKKLDTRS